MQDPIMLDPHRTLKDHHGRLDAVEAEARAVREEVAGIRGDLTALRGALDRLLRVLGYVLRVLGYVLAAVLALAGAVGSAWCGQLEGWPHQAQLAAALATALLCGIAGLLVARTDHTPAP